jgi:hypothetical protein
MFTATTRLGIATKLIPPRNINQVAVFTAAAELPNVNTPKNAIRQLNFVNRPFQDANVIFILCCPPHRAHDLSDSKISFISAAYSTAVPHPAPYADPAASLAAVNNAIRNQFYGAFNNIH